MFASSQEPDRMPRWATSSGLMNTIIELTCQIEMLLASKLHNGGIFEAKGNGGLWQCAQPCYLKQHRNPVWNVHLAVLLAKPPAAASV